MPESRQAQLQANLEKVRRRMVQAAGRCGRGNESIRLVGVTKYVDAATAGLLVQAGCSDLGESRPQGLWEKASALGGVPSWHLIGHLQRNKVKRTLEYASWIHSVDSERLLRAIESHAASAGKPVDVLLEVNISGETAKQGLGPERLGPVLEAAAGSRWARVRGLMGMAGLEGGQDAARRQFASLRGLRDQWRRTVAPEVDLRELSMGMSGDFEVAIEEGATIIRVGTLLFEGLR